MPKPPLPSSLIIKSQITPQILQYREDKYALLNDHIGKKETKSIFYSLKQFKEIWDEIQYQTTDRLKKVSGLRIYLASYPETSGAMAGSESTRDRRMNLILVLTEDIGTAANPLHKDLYIEDDAVDFALRQGLTSGSDFDHGTPCPPDCDGQDPFFP